MQEYGNEAITYEFVLLRSMMQISELASRIYFSPKSEWQTNALNISYSLDMLESQAWPFLSEAYQKKSKILDRAVELLLELYKLQRRQNAAAYIKKGQNYEMRLVLNRVKIKQRFLQKELDNARLLRKKLSHAIDEAGAFSEDVTDHKEIADSILQDVGR